MSESDCLFCKIVAGQIPSDKVYEDDEVVAFRDIRPKAPVHILVVPCQHFASLNDASEAERSVLGKMLLLTKQLADKEGIAEDGYRVVNNCGAHGGQEVPHIHFHLLGGRQMTWPPG